MNSRTSKLAQYTLLSGAFLATHEALADVVYTDLHPDIYLTEFNSKIELDLNNDGMNDFHFLNWNKNFNTYNSYGEPWHEFEIFVQWVGPVYDGLNRIAGETYSDYQYNVGVFVYYYPFAIESGDIVSSALNFYPHWINQRMAFKEFTADNDSHRFWKSGGYWAPGCDEKFLGVYFADTEDSMHYGWIRCSIIDTAEGIIIHDYAYETVTEKPIIAGATFGNADLEDAGNYTMYSHNNSLYVYLNTDTIHTVMLEVFDLQGNLVYSEQMIDHFNKIPLILPSAIYIARLRNHQWTLKTVKLHL